MSKTYRLIWNDILNTWVAVAEIVKARGKHSSNALLLSTVLVAVAPAPTFAQTAPPPATLPSGGQVAAGTVSVAQSGAVMNITQATPRAAIDWQTFNVGSQAQVNFIQPSSSAVTLNRVLSANPSQIFGQLNANGQVFLTNPGGIYFAPGASANVGALVATTHRISNEDFMAGNFTFARNGASGSVVNEGNLSAQLGGYIALLAPEVRNQGVIVAQAGTVALAAGEAFSLSLSDARLTGVVVEPAAISALVDNGHAVRARDGVIILSAQAANQLQGGVVNNSGTLEANGLVSNGGTVKLLASDRVAHSGTINVDAAPEKVGAGGTALLIADTGNPASVVDIGGRISARGGALGGAGGFVETSAAQVQIADSFRVDTSAPQGQTGQWLIDPVDITIAASGGNVTGSVIATALQTTSVTLDTASSGGCTGVACTFSGTNGDIFVNDHIAVVDGSADTTLTLKANRNIIMDADKSISRTGSYKLNTILWADSDVTDGGGIHVKPGAAISSNGGNVVLSGGTDYNSGFAIGTPGIDRTDMNGLYGDGAGILIQGSITTAGGDINLRGGVELASTPSTSTAGIHMTQTGLLSAGAGNITLTGKVAASVTASPVRGIWLGDGATSTSKAQLLTTTGAINLTGTHEGSSSGGGAGILLDSAAIQTTSGHASLTGTQRPNNEFDIYLHAGGSTSNTITSTSGSIDLNADTVCLIGTTSIGSAGALTFAPRTAGTTIGIGGGTGTLQLPSTLFSTNFTNGFSNITIGSADAGNITLAGSTSYNDPLTFKTAGNITMNAGSSLTGTVGQTAHLTYWAGADGSGQIDLNGVSGSLASVTTNGGNLTLGGGTDIASGFAQGGSGEKNGGINLRYANLNAGSGDIIMRAKGTGTSDYAYGLYLNNSSLAGNNLTLTGYGSEIGAWANQGIVFDTSTLSTATGAIALTGYGGWNAGDGGGNQRGIHFDTASSITASGAGTLTLTGYGGSKSGGSGSQNFGLYVGGDLSTAAGGTITINGYSGHVDPRAVVFGPFGVEGLTANDLSTSSALTVNAYAGPGTTTAGTIEINNKIETTNQLTLTAAGSISNGSSGYIVADKLALLGGSVTLTHADNNVNTLAASGVSSLIYTDSNALTIGTTTPTGISASGPIRIETLSGDLSMTENIATTNTTADAVILNAGKNPAAGTATGGNILVTSGKTVIVGAGGTAKLYSGGVSDSTGLTALVGSGSARFRYNSDETTSNFTTALATGMNAIYREQPTASVTVGNQTITYGDTPSSSATTSGLVNGDSPTYTISGRLDSSSGNIKASSTPYTLTASDLSGLGYQYSKTDGTLTINAKTLTLASIAAANKLYDGNNNVTITNAGSLSGVVGVDTVTVSNTAATFDDTHAGTGKTVTLSGIALSGGDAGNYSIANTATTTANITAATLTPTLSNTGVSKIYDGSTTAPSGFTPTYTFAGLISGDTAASLTHTGAAYNDKDVAEANKLTVSGLAIGTIAGSNGSAASDYVLAAASKDVTASIAAKPVTLSASKTYDGTTTLSASQVTIGGTVDSESLSYTGATANDAHVATADKYIHAITLANGANGGLASNYQLPTLNAANAPVTISTAQLAVTANNASKVYGELKTFTGAEFSPSGLVNGETIGSVSLSSTGSAATADVAGSPYAIVAGNATGGSFDAANYAITYTNGSLSITPRPVTVTSDAKTKQAGNADPTLTYQAEGLSAGRGLVTGETLTGSLNRIAGESAANYAIEQGTVTNANNGNYNIAYVGANLTITAAPLSPSPEPVTPTPEPPAPTPVSPTPTPKPPAPTPVPPTPTPEPPAPTPVPPTPTPEPPAPTPVPPTPTPVPPAPTPIPPPPPAPLPVLPTPSIAPPPLLSTPFPAGGSVLPTTVASAGAINAPSHSGIPVSTHAATPTPAAGTTNTLGNGGVSISLVRQPSMQTTGIIAVSVPQEMATAGGGFSFPLPEQLTADLPTANPTIQVNLMNGDPLPAWLSYTPETRSFVAAAVPDGAFPIQVNVTIGDRSTTVVISERTE